MKIKDPFRTNAGNVTREAQQQEQARTARYDQTAQRINQVFDDPRRNQQRVDFANALRAQLGDQLQRGYTDSARQAKFSLAKRGLTGGSVDVDTQWRLGETLTRGKLAAEGQAQDAFADMLDQDENSRFSLLDAARSGASAGQAAQRAGQMMLGRPQLGTGGALGNVFSDFANDLRRQTEQSEYRRGASSSMWS